jgi:hypothetical protein
VWIKRYEVYAHPGENYEDQIVKRGFSWPAFLVAPIWSFFKGLPLHGITLMFLFLFVNLWPVGENLLLAALLFFLGLGAAVFAGVRGNAWVRKRLEKCGFTLVRTVHARTLGGALDLSEAQKKSEAAV